MTFGERVRARREEMGMSRQQLAGLLGVTLSAVSNYEKGISFPREDVILRLFDALETEPNVLFQDSFRSGGQVLTQGEQTLLEQYRGLSMLGRETVRSMVEALCAYRDDLEEGRTAEQEPRVIPLYRSPAAAGYAAPVFGEDFGYLPVKGDVPGRGGVCRPDSRATPWHLMMPTAPGGVREPGPAAAGRCGDLLRGW